MYTRQVQDVAHGKRSPDVNLEVGAAIVQRQHRVVEKLSFLRRVATPFDPIYSDSSEIPISASAIDIAKDWMT